MYGVSLVLLIETVRIGGDLVVSWLTFGGVGPWLGMVDMAFLCIISDFCLTQLMTAHEFGLHDKDDVK